MKTIKLLKTTIVGGKAVSVGKEVEASDKDAFYLIHTGAAIAVKPKAKAPPKKAAPENKQVETSEIETR